MKQPAQILEPLMDGRLFMGMNSALLRAAMLALVWWIVAEASLRAWSLGVPAVLIATAVSLFLVPPTGYRVRPMGLAGFVLYFLGQSVRAGWDVARRILHPRLPLRPGLIECALQVPVGLPRALLVTTLNLLPGTLVVRLGESHLMLHVLDLEAPIPDEVARIQARVAALFGLPRTEAAS